MSRLLPHVHLYKFVKVGVDFTYSNAEIDKMMEDNDPRLAGAAFAGPIVSFSRCRCGDIRKKRM